MNCPRCGRENRPEARFCRSCKASLESQADPAAEMKAGLSLGGMIQDLWGSLTSWLKEELPPAPVSSQPRTRVLVSEAPSTAPIGPGQPLASGSILRHPTEKRQYAILVARQLEYSIYYDGLDLVCLHCHEMHDQPPELGLCRCCQAPLSTVLIHERRTSSDPHPPERIQQLLTISGGHVGILPHRDILQYREHVYTVTVHPGQWGVLVRRRQPCSIDEAIAGTVQVGETLSYLHSCGFSCCDRNKLTVEGLILVGGDDVRLADLSGCAPLPLGDPRARTQINRDIRFLGALLFCLATGEWSKRIGQVLDTSPAELRTYIQRAVQGEYATVQDMLTDFQLMPSLPVPARSLRTVFGHAVHPGRKYARNEDATATFTFSREQDGRTVPIGFFLVADGMGGHDAGDVASRTVSDLVSEWLLKVGVLPDLHRATRKLSTEHAPGDALAQAIQQANEKLWQSARARSSDLGSTVAAVLVIGDVATVANVGDSRVYLLRGGRLQQITQDHSLVARLVDAGVIQPEEVRSHPQRNQIYRCLGHGAQVQVDTSTFPLQYGDRLILCSDGLWEMVLDADIQRIVEQARSPQQACDALIEAANRAGGEDNISVIVVEME